MNDPPALDLDADNSSGAGGANYAATFVEDAAAVAVVDTLDATLVDADLDDLQSLTVTLTNGLDGLSEVLAANTSGTFITASYDSLTGVLSLSGVDTAAHYQQVLRTVTYYNSSQSPDLTPREIRFVAHDGTQYSNVATTTITIVGQNDSPVALGESFAVNNNAALSLATPGLLANDTDPDLDPLAAILVTQPAHGTLTLQPDGAFLYVPDIAFMGTDSFTYKATDGVADSSAVTVTIDVIPAVGPPPPPPPPDDPGPVDEEEEQEVDETVPPPVTAGTRSSDQPDDSRAAIRFTSKVWDSQAEGDYTQVQEQLGIKVARATDPDVFSERQWEQSDWWQVRVVVALPASTPVLAGPTTSRQMVDALQNIGALQRKVVADTEYLWQEVDVAWEKTELPDAWAEALMIGTATVLTTALSATYVFWILRGIPVGQFRVIDAGLAHA